MDSPMAKALMKREIDEVIKVRLPEGEAEFEILEVRYD
jgi:transcription elongation GreA/GreB family factor